jgi:hypothetical protein
MTISSGQNLIVIQCIPSRRYSIDEGVVTFPHILGRLAVLKVQREWGGDNKGDTHDNKDLITEKTTFADGNNSGLSQLSIFETRG